MEELDLVVLTEDFKDLKKGTKGTIVLKYTDTDFEVEFFDNEKNTISVYTISSEYLKPREEEEKKK